MLGSIGEQFGKSVESVWKKEGRLQWEGLAEEEGLSLERRSEGVMDDESGESMEPIEEVLWCAAVRDTDRLADGREWCGCGGRGSTGRQRIRNARD